MYLTADEVAGILRLDPKTVRKMVNNGKLRGHRFGRQYRIPIDALEGLDVEAMKKRLMGKLTPSPAAAATATSAPAKADDPLA